MDFNNKYFQNERTQIQVFSYNQYHLPFILQFTNFKVADNYRIQLSMETEIKKLLNKPDDVVFITTANFQVVFKEKRFNDYGAFFLKNLPEWLAKQ